MHLAMIFMHSSGLSQMSLRSSEGGPIYFGMEFLHIAASVILPDEDFFRCVESSYWRATYWDERVVQNKLKALQVGS